MAEKFGLLRKPEVDSEFYGTGEDLTKSVTNYVNGSGTGQWVFMRVK